MSFDLGTNIQQHWKTWEELQGLKKDYKILQEKYEANVEAYNSQAQDLNIANQTLEIYRDMHNQACAEKEGLKAELMDYKNWYINRPKHTNEQIETLRFDNEHLQKDVAEKDLQIAALKDRLGEYEKMYFQSDMFKDKPDNLEKEKEYWKDAAENARKDVAHWQTKAERLMEDRQNEPYWKAQAANLRRENAAYKKLLEPILEYAQTLSKT